MDAVVAVFVMEVCKSTDNCSDMLEGGVESNLAQQQNYKQFTYAASQQLNTLQKHTQHERPGLIASSPIIADIYQEADIDAAFVTDMYFAQIKENRVPLTKKCGCQQQVEDNNSSQKQRLESPSFHNIPWSRQRQSFNPAPTSVSLVNNDNDVYIMDDYRNSLPTQNREERSGAPTQPRFNFSPWSQQANASQSIIRKWKE
ncbi:unnamed protein product [Peronospora belbahrii]|uniref:Uncharacterized protein n=1 Tax=Peronospora belbahrii TaxID=622444 RepID=A0AAU9L028_9STRA|nr:unnamed protein product [Peronospora belbahrii]